MGGGVAPIALAFGLYINPRMSSNNYYFLPQDIRTKEDVGSKHMQLQITLQSL